MAIFEGVSIMAARFLLSYPCEDACCEVMTDRIVEGAPVYRCPGCDSEWIELRERKAPNAVAEKPESVRREVASEVVPPRRAENE